MSHIRSISFPSRVHPSATRVENELNKLKSSGSVFNNLFGLEELYICLDEFLNLQSTQQSLSQGSSRAVDDILDGSVKILDVCGVSRDLVVEVKERVRDLLSAIRRRRGDSTSTIAEYAEFRKKVKKDAKRSMAALKQVLGDNQDQDSETQLAIKVLRQVNVSSSDVLKSLLMFLSGPKQSKWSVISRIVHKGAAAVDCEEKERDVNELAAVDSSLTSLCNQLRCRGSDDVEKTHQTVQKQLEALEMSIGSIEDGLECIFRRLIKSRTSLLNIISQ